jgi:type I restriction enzyme S subunit
VNISPYSQYQQTGIEWLGLVPGHWQVLSIKRLTPVQRGASPRPIEDPKYFDEHGEYAWVRIADVTSNDHYLRDSTQRLSELGKSLSVALEPGTLFLSIAGSVGKPMITAIKACIHDGFVHFPHLQINSEFLYYVFDSGQPYLGLGKFGTQLNLNTDTVGDIKIGLPPRDEQDAIAAFLEWKTSQIDALIAKKQALLQKLKEKRLAIITQAVTKGQNPDASMRDSGVAWIGEVPSHWIVKRLKFIARIGNGSTPSREDSSYWDDGIYPWLNSSVVNQESVTQADQFVTSLALSECHLPRITPPAVLVGITGQGKTRGMATTLLFESTINQHLAYVKSDESKALVGYMRRVFDMAYSYLRSESENGGSTKGAITCEQIAELPVPVPPIAEQIAITATVDQSITRIDRMVGKAQSAITRLTEYRTALITAATTGKIDVRNWQATETPA